MSLWLCLRFEQLPLQCLDRSEHLPVAVLEKQRVLRTNDAGLAAGIRQGQGTATVRTLAEDARLLERDPGSEQRALEQLCCWAYSLSPTLHCYREDCLLLEVGGCLGLFGGIEPLLAQAVSGIGSRGYSAARGLAATPKASWLLSFADNSPDTGATGWDDTALRQQLAPLPLDILDDFARTVDSLRRAGLHRLGDILSLPPAALARRCGRSFTHFLEQVLGTADDHTPDYVPPARFSDEYWFGYEVKANQELLPAIQLLLQALCLFLRNTQLQTGDISWRLIGIDGHIRNLTVRSTLNHSDWENWYQLTCIRLEQLQLETAVEGIFLECEELRSGELQNNDLFSPGNQREPLGGLLDRLRSRLGLQAIHHMGCRDEHLPEHALYTAAEPRHPSGHKSQAEHRAQRPFWLMPQPQQLRQRGRELFWNGRLQLVYGPERIEDNWWREPVSRDYYIASDPRGLHYWVFRDRLARAWFIHGIFA